MNAIHRILKHLPLLLLACWPATAAITIPGITGTPAAGVDGELNLVSDHRVIDLSESLPGTWDSIPRDGTKGVYDTNKWAVVFKYSSVNISRNLELGFRNNSARAPVVWLVSGDVTITGTLNLNAAAYTASADYQEPGPGGFRGGTEIGVRSGGMGPGGGNRNSAGASHKRQDGIEAGPSYGDPEIRQLIGGSGSAANSSGRGGAGGGAILIVATGKIVVNGNIFANGSTVSGVGGGSGGAVRLVASSIEGSGLIQTLGTGTSPGFVRTEAETYGVSNPSVHPLDYSVATITGPIAIWPEDNAPTARIVSVSNLPVPADPKAALGLAPTDVNVPLNGSRQVRIETRNFPTSGTVTLFVTPVQGDRTALTATMLPGGSNDLATWEATLDSALTGRAALQVRAAAE
ncbi:MAG: hypothetical protein JNL10_17960 [Verrucomicrobiales bacterium]|nr:hypothetical protein [Verrucomicrobiales bacterium]